MTRNLKALGLALIAVLAMAAIGAQAASAHKFVSDQEKTVLTGANETGTKDVFTITGTKKLEVKCTTTTVAGTQIGNEAETITVHPKYSGCETVIPVAVAEVKTGGCNYVFAGTTTKSTFFPTEEHATVSIDCETTAGEHLHTFKIESSGCTIEVGTTNPAGTIVNQNMHGVRYTNLPAHEVKTEGGAIDKVEAVTQKQTVRGIIATTKGANCSLLGVKEGTYTNATYDGSAIVTGYKDEGIVSGSTTNGFVYKEGVLANITVK